MKIIIATARIIMINNDNNYNRNRNLNTKF